MTLEEFEEKMNLLDQYIGVGLFICGSIQAILGNKASFDFRETMTPTIDEMVEYNNHVGCFWGVPRDTRGEAAKLSRYELILMWEEHVLTNELYLRF